MIFYFFSTHLRPSKGQLMSGFKVVSGKHVSTCQAKSLQGACECQDFIFGLEFNGNV